MKRALPFLFLAVGLAQAAASVTPAGQTGLALLSQTGASLPSTCMIGQLFFNTAAGTGSKIYGCESANTWAVQGGTTVTWASLMTALGVVSPSDSTFPATSGTIATLPPIGALSTYGLVWVDSAGHLGTTTNVVGLVKGSGTGYAAATVGTDYLAPVAGVVDAGNNAVTNISHLGVGYSGTPDVVARFVGDNGAYSRVVMRGYSNDASGSSIRTAKFRGTIGSPAVPESGDSLGSFQHAGYSGVSADAVAGAYTKGTTTEKWTTTANGAKMGFYTTPNGSTTQTLALELGQDQSATFANTVNATTFVGALTGNASGTSANVTGVVATANGGSGSADLAVAARNTHRPYVLTGSGYNSAAVTTSTTETLVAQFVTPASLAGDMYRLLVRQTHTGGTSYSVAMKAYLGGSSGTIGAAYTGGGTAVCTWSIGSSKTSLRSTIDIVVKGIGGSASEDCLGWSVDNAALISAVSISGTPAVDLTATSFISITAAAGVGTEYGTVVGATAELMPKE